MDLNTPHEEKEKVLVCVRIRPLQAQELINNERTSWIASDSTTLTFSGETENGSARSGSQTARPGHMTSRASPAAHGLGSTTSVSQSIGAGVLNAAQLFTYNRVFSQSTGSEEVYEHSAKQLVRSAMSGYNCTIFAYGQTGSGKTYTMRSLMSQSTRDIFQQISETPNRVFVIRMTAMEIYNEVVKDLLPHRETAEASTTTPGFGTGAAETDKGLKVFDDPDNGGTFVEGLAEYCVESADHLETLLQSVEKHRHVRDTKMNASSSRSHQLVRLYVESRANTPMTEDGEVDVSAPNFDPDEAPMTMSTICFCDLAGSERMSQAAGTEDVGKEKLRQIEAVSINKSLLTLGTVIRALGNSEARKGHIKYRESKLTRILQPSLSGNARMAIVCNISPAATSVNQSMAALHFANAAKNIVMRPVVNAVGDDKAVIRRMMAEIQSLKAQLISVPQAKTSRADELNAELSIKEEQVRQGTQEKDRLQRRLAGLEKLVLHGNMGPPLNKRRKSLDGILEAGDAATTALGRSGSTGTPEAQLLTFSRLSSNRTPGSTAALRASWNPSSSYKPPPISDEKSGRQSVAVGRGTPGEGNKLFLDLFLHPSVRKAASRASASLGRDASITASPVPKLNLSALGTPPPQPPAQGSGSMDSSAVANARSDIEKLPHPVGPQAAEALAALQAEVRCLKHGSDSLSASVVSPRTGARASDRHACMANSTGEAAVREAIIHLRQELCRLEVNDGAAASAAAIGEMSRESTEKDELVAAMRSELSRLERGQAANTKAENALESLKKKMEDPGMPDDDELDEGLSTVWPSEMLDECEDDVPPPVRTNSVTSVNMGGAVKRSLLASGGEESDLSRSDPLMLGTTCVLPSATFSPGILAEGGGAFNPVEGADEQEVEQGPGTPQKSAYSASGTAQHFADLGGSRRDVSASVGMTPQSKQKVAQLKRGSFAQSDCADSMDHKAQSKVQISSTSQTDVRTSNMDQDLDAGEVASSIGREPGSSSISGTGSLRRWDAAGVREVLKSQKEALTAWYKGELRRMHSTFKASAEQDVLSLKEAVEQYKEQTERLETQKKILLNQVLQLEFSLEEQEVQQEELNRQVAHVTTERDHARFKEKQVRAAAKATLAVAHTAHMAESEAAAAARQRGSRESVSDMPGQIRNFESPAFIDPSDDGWEAQDTPSTLIVRIIELWDELFTPLGYRSRFLLNFRGRELFYYELEHRRLQWRRSQANEAKGPRGERCKELERAARAMDWERKSLANQLKYLYTEEQRGSLFNEWKINPSSKERKLQLVNKLWQNSTLLEFDNGAERSAELVVALSGPGDATSQFMELFFSRNTRVLPNAPSALGSALNRLMPTPRSRGGPPLTGAPSGGLTPRRSSKNFMSFMSIGGSRRRDAVEGATNNGQ